MAGNSQRDLHPLAALDRRHQNRFASSLPSKWCVPMSRVTDMTRYAIDAPTLLHLVANDVQVSPTHQIVAPSLIRSEALSLLFEAVWRGDLSEDLALRHHERLTEMKMRLLGDRVSRRAAWKMARQQGWESTHDAEYLAIAKLQADALITVNPALARKAKSLVPLADVAALAAD